jgi:AraC-like DNA-binding protein
MHTGCTTDAPARSCAAMARVRERGAAARSRLVEGAAGGSAWKLAMRAPAAPVAGLVHGEYVGYSERTPGGSRRKELPGPFVVVVIEMAPPIRVHAPVGGAGRYQGGFVAGLHDRFAITEHDGFQRGIQVNLTPLGARRLLGLPLSELAGRVVSLRDLLPAEHRPLAERLDELPDWDARFDLLDDLLLARMTEARVDTRTVSWAVARIEESGGLLDVGALCQRLGYTHKHVIDLFRDQVGMPPKRLARIVRFHRLAEHLRRGGGGTWAELALAFGFYDQAHLAREVREICGSTPTQVRPTLIDFEGSLA